MKIRLISALVLTLIASFIPASSYAADDRFFQWGKTDVKNPDGLSANFDITSVQVALTSDGYIQFYVMLQGVDPLKYKDNAYVGVSIADMTGPRFIFTTREVIYSGGARSEVKVFDVKSKDAVEVNNCEATTWIPSTNDSVAFEILASCLKDVTNVSVTGFANDGIFKNYSPDSGEVFKIKTNYMASKSCTVKTKDTKFSFDGTQYICNLKNGKWSWVDYAPIAAAKAKYLTEKAFYLCRLNKNVLGVVLSDKGKTLELNGVSKYLVSDAQFACVTSALGMPSSVKSKLRMTRALDGIQNAKFGKLSADWSFHPDDGLSITFTYN